MSEFEYVAVLLSIVFGLAITQLLSGTVRLFFEDRVDDVRLGWALAVTLALIINWWSFFQWRDAEQWAVRAVRVSHVLGRIPLCVSRHSFS